MESLWLVVFTVATLVGLAFLFGPILRWQGIPDFFQPPASHSKEKAAQALRDAHLDHVQGKLSQAEWSAESDQIRRQMLQQVVQPSHSGDGRCPACGFRQSVTDQQSYCPRCGIAL